MSSSFVTGFDVSQHAEKPITTNRIDARSAISKSWPADFEIIFFEGLMY